MDDKVEQISKIRDFLMELEQRKQIKVIYCCEAGSRAFGGANDSSDFDVRFLYIHKMDWYLSIEERKKDTIEDRSISKMDISGWEITKALRLIRKSNPTIFEWLQSPIIYQEVKTLIESLKNIAALHFSPQTALYHYVHMAKRNLSMALKNSPIGVKHYLNVIRPFLNAKWIEEKQTPPPLCFHNLISMVQVPSRIRGEMESIFCLKKEGILFLPKDMIFLNRYMVEEIEGLEDHAKEMPKQRIDQINRLNEWFRSSLTYVEEGKEQQIQNKRF